MVKQCKCEEGKLPGGFVLRKVEGERVPLEPMPGWNRVHDCDYVAARNALIPEAEALADVAVAHLPPGSAREQVRSRAFYAAMDDLWRRRAVGAFSAGTS